MKAVSMVENGDFFERRGREGFAEGAEEVKEREDKSKKSKNKNIFVIKLIQLRVAFCFGFLFVPSFLRPLRNLRALCVQKFFAFGLSITNQPDGAAK